VDLNFSYHATGKLTADGSIGWEWRSGDGGEAQDGFVYDFGLNYQVRPQTLIMARGSRRSFATALGDHGTRRSTNFEVSVTQTLFTRFMLGLAIGYEHSEYGGEQDVLASAREDDYVYIRPSLGTNITPRLSISLFYEYRNNDSSGVDGRSFQGNLFGTQLTYRF
jgi:uncharacterized protein (PEP-CTERM system associated)